MSAHTAAQTRNWVDVGSQEEFAADGMRVVVAEGREIGVATVNGELFAVRNLCPHAKAPLCLGGLHGDKLTAGDRVGELAVEMAAPHVSCPWHGWEFDLRTGACLFDPKIKAKSYPVAVRDGRVLIDAGRGESGAPNESEQTG